MQDPTNHGVGPAKDGAGAPDRAPRTISLMNQKGGVGKTTTTVNLAASLAALGRRTLLIDLDPQAHATLHLGIDPGALGHSVYDVLLDPGSVSPMPARDGLDLLPAVTDLAAAESELATEPDRQGRLTRAISACASQYDDVLIDCPPSLGLLTLNALAASGEVLVPMQPHFLALQGLGKLLETVRLIGANVNENLRVAGVVLCMYEESTRLAREVVADIEAFFTVSAELAVPWRSAKVYKPPIRRNIKLAESPSFGQTIFEYAPTCQGAKDYKKLGQALLDDVVVASEPASPPAKPAAPVPAPEGATPAPGASVADVVVRKIEPEPATAKAAS